jgi:hypothetical protein
MLVTRVGDCVKAGGSSSARRHAAVEPAFRPDTFPASGGTGSTGYRAANIKIPS